MDSAYESIVVRYEGPIATLLLNRPDVRNALDMTMRAEMLDALDAIGRHPEVRVLVVAGAGGHFCAGGDMKSLRSGPPPTASAHRDRVRILNRLVLRLNGFPRPTIASVEGYALGSGCNLALSCDIVLAADSARFGQVFSKVGLVPDGGASWLLPRIVGLARAKELVYTGQILHADEAARLGLVSRVVAAAELSAATGELALRIAQGPPEALAVAKRLLNQGSGSDLATALEAEALAQGDAVIGNEHKEGLEAFFAKRSPRF